jgi:CRISPR/Cas system CSM-associated protein Csm5 (group 7 of RAMP superfamily)
MLFAVACTTSLSSGAHVISNSVAQLSDNELIQGEQLWALPGNQIDDTFRAWEAVRRFTKDASLRDYSVTYEKDENGESFVSFVKNVPVSPDPVTGLVVVPTRIEAFGVVVTSEHATLVDGDSE